MENKNIIITGDAYWAALSQPNTTFTPAWQLDVAHLDAETVKMLKGHDLNVRECDKEEHNRGMFITLKRKTHTNGGEAKKPVKVVDSKNNAWPSDVLIGNGSKVNAKFHCYTNNYGTFAELDAVQVVDLVEYSGRSDFDEVPDGFVVSGDNAFADVKDLEDIPL